MLKTVNKIINTGLIILSIVCAICLLICFLSVYISPAKIWFFAYFGLFFQFLFILNLILFILWIVKRKKRLIILHIIALIPSIFFAGYFFRLFGSSKDIETNFENIKVLSYNIQGFKIPFQHNTTHKEIAGFLNKEDADIICLQEFYTNDKVTEQLFQKLISKYKYHSVYYSVKNKKNSYGIATFSKYPIKMMLEIPFEKTANAAIYTDIDVKGRILRVYNVHFQSIKLNLPKLLSSKNRMGEIEEVSSRLKTAFIKRAGQVDIVSKHIGVSPYPVIVCGDFNDTPISYTYMKIKGNRKDTFCEAGRGMPSTYRLSFMPSFRIDYMLHDDVMNSKTYKVYKEIDYSDHYPIASVINIEDIQQQY